MDEFERQVLKIAANPGRYMILERDVRRTLLKRFPYLIYFRQPRPDAIRITVVKYVRRHPAYGRERECTERPRLRRTVFFGGGAQ